MIVDRRTFLAGNLAFALNTPAAAAFCKREEWTFDNLQQVGGHKITPIGSLQIMNNPWGRAVRFDGVNDGMLIDPHPLAGASRFVVKGLFKPEGRAYKQHWLYLESHQAPFVPGGTPGKASAACKPEGRAYKQHWLYLESHQAPFVPDGKGDSRLLFEIRVLGDRWNLDAFTSGSGYRQAMMALERHSRSGGGIT